MMGADWWEDIGNVSAFARWLVEEEGWEVTELLAMLEKPWNWTEEYRLFEADSK